MFLNGKSDIRSSYSNQRQILIEVLYFLYVLKGYALQALEHLRAILYFYVA